MRLVVLRTIFTDDVTGGVILADDDFIGYSLEDRTRPPDQKIDGRTSIPAGKYTLILSMSKRFGRVMPELLSVPGFVGVRIHGGNSVEDTRGCVLAAAKRNGKEHIYQSIETKITGLIKKDIESTIEIINTLDGRTYLCTRLG